MNNSSSFAENLLLSPLLRQRDFSPLLSPLLQQPRRGSQDFQELIEFDLEQTPIHLSDPQLPHLHTDEHLQESSLQQPHSQALPYLPQAQLSDNQEPLTPELPPSNKLEQASEESSVPMMSLGVKEDGSPVETLINYLIVNSKMAEERIQLEAQRMFPSDHVLQEVFTILSRKFRRLRKTKQEMVKYCIRKAFKYVTELTKKSTKIRDLDGAMQQYFAEDGGCSFSIPFKKNSMEKTMNGCFLRRIFSCERFTNDYAKFVKDFRELILQDNRKKVAYLAQLIQQAVTQGVPSRVQKIKRLPWTMDILQETNQLALTLGENKGEGIGRRTRR